MAAILRDQELQIVGACSGHLPRPATVTDGEVQATTGVIRFVASLQSSLTFDVAIDSQLALTQHQHGSVISSTSGRWMDTWNSRRLVKLVWGKARLTQEAFCRKHRAGQVWRWLLNKRADQLAGEVAAAAFDWQCYHQLQQVDNLCMTPSHFLGDRVKTILMESDKPISRKL